MVKTLAVHCHSDVCSVPGGHPAGCRRSWVRLQHHATVVTLKMLQYVAASFDLPSVSTANFNTVQFRKPHKKYEVPIIPALAKSNVLLHQSNITAAFVQSPSIIFSALSPGLPTYHNHYITQYTVLLTTVTSN